MPKVTKWTEADFEVRPSNIPGAGLGLFATVAIKEGDTLGYYTGTVIDGDAMDEEPWVRSKYILWVCQTHVIVGEGPEANYTRFINHSDSPNAFLVVSSRWKTARFEALRDIRPGEEIYFHYGDDYWEVIGETPTALP